MFRGGFQWCVVVTRHVMKCSHCFHVSKQYKNDMWSESRGFSPSASPHSQVSGVFQCDDLGMFIVLCSLFATLRTDSSLGSCPRWSLFQEKSYMILGDSRFAQCIMCLSQWFHTYAGESQCGRIFAVSFINTARKEGKVRSQLMHWLGERRSEFYSTDFLCDLEQVT